MKKTDTQAVNIWCTREAPNPRKKSEPLREYNKQKETLQVIFCKRLMREYLLQHEQVVKDRS